MPGDTNKLREGLPHHEADIHWPERCCLDLKLTDGFEYDGKDITPCDVDIPLRTWVVDVEVISPSEIVPDYKTPQYETACVVVWDSFTKKQEVFSTKDIDERTMWEWFIRYLKQCDPDVLLSLIQI